MRVDTPEEVAALMAAKWELGPRPGASSIANPVPAEDEMPRDEIDAVIEQALADCDERGIHGKDITPFLLGRIVELSGGRSLETNMALVRNNAVRRHRHRGRPTPPSADGTTPNDCLTCALAGYRWPS